jgi:hypothetical protein
MNFRTKWIVSGGVALALLGAGTGVAVATGVVDNGDDHPITGTALQEASAAALAYTHGGRVTGTENGDEESQYEVEVTLADGKQVDVQLDADFHVVTSKTDHESKNDTGKRRVASLVTSRSADSRQREHDRHSLFARSG